MTQVLVVEPQLARRRALQRELERRGFAVLALADLAPEALAVPEGLPAAIDAVVCSTTLPSGAALRLLDRIDRAPLILTAEHGSVLAAVAAMKAGAAHYFVHPVEPEALVAAIRSEIAARARALPPTQTPWPTPLVGHCGAMTRLFDQVQALAGDDNPVLIRGEVGTGKEHIARLLHAQSRRRNRPFVVLNCARVPEDLLEIELFGRDTAAGRQDHGVRAGLVKAAEGGTLYVEDVADLPPTLQTRLIRVLEDSGHGTMGAVGHVPDVRLVAATRHDLEEALEAGRFEADLYYRLTPVALDVPPLRERESDLPELAQHLLEHACVRLNRTEPPLSPGALDAIRSYTWPGNVRELENAIERAVILNRGGPILPEDLGIEVNRRGLTPGTGEDATSLEDYFVRFVTDHEDALTETELAQKLGISRKSLWERRQRLNIPRRRTRQRGPRRDA